MSDPLTKRQAKALKYIGAFLNEHRYAPTFDEIGAHMGSGKQAAFELVDRLIVSGYLAKVEARDRSLTLTSEGLAWGSGGKSDPDVALTLPTNATQHAAPGVE